MCSNCIDFKLKEEGEKTPVGQTLLEDSDKPPRYLCYLNGEICRCCKRHLEAAGFKKYLKWGSEIIEILLPSWQHWRILMRHPCVWLENWGFGLGYPRGRTEQFREQQVSFIIARFKGGLNCEVFVVLFRSRVLHHTLSFYAAAFERQTMNTCYWYAKSSSHLN